MKHSILLSILLLIILAGCNPQQSPKVCYKDICFEVELAQTPEQRSTGLMYREQLDEHKGMLFIFEQESIHSFWMKNTLIPLDIIWIDSNDKVVYIKESAEPCTTEVCSTINPNKKAKYVLELNAGATKEINLKQGEILKIYK